MWTALTNISDTPGHWFRLLSLCFGSFVFGYWIWLFLYALYVKRIRPRVGLRGYLRWAALMIFLAGYMAIQFEALFVNKNAVMLWGNWALPIGSALMLWAGLLLVQANFNGHRRRDEK